MTIEEHRHAISGSARLLFDGRAHILAHELPAGKVLMAADGSGQPFFVANRDFASMLADGSITLVQ